MASLSPSTATASALDADTEAFLTHTWQNDSSGNDNHKRVAMINKELKRQGVKVWFDDERMNGARIVSEMCNGIDNSDCVVCFVTQVYIDKVQGKNGPDDNCLREFDYAIHHKTSNKIITVVMEPELFGKPWQGPVGMSLKGRLQIPFTEDSQVKDACTQIIAEIRRIQGVSSPRSASAVSATSSSTIVSAGGAALHLEDLRKIDDLTTFFSALDMTRGDASRYATNLVTKHGMSSIKKLKKSYDRKNTVLTDDYGITIADAEEIAEALITLPDQSTKANPLVPTSAGGASAGGSSAGVKGGTGALAFPTPVVKPSPTNPQQTINYTDGSVYVGHVVNGKAEGQGKKTWPSGKFAGHVYVGSFRNDMKEGEGKYTWPNGHVYVGSYRNGNMEGEGKFTFASGDVYVGSYRNDKREGEGKYTYANGDVYVGSYRNDMKEGEGTHTFANGDVYVGSFRNDKQEGEGTHTFASGNVYVGSFRNDNMEGRGTFTWPNGAVYVGSYRSDMKEGRGKHTYADGSVYHDGEWKDDKPVK